ncbi:hypothetical protein NVP1213O_32 [Vibrio phage 1.213.O._10N.222.54.F10]|nr:hypothetical protein NVP1213O_32 [Vibrio phage 1.213.O._10N.222.54.F10]
MASKNFTGYLRSSLGSYAGHDLWRFTHISNTGEVVAGSAEEFRVAENGFYDIDIEYGNVVIESKSSLSRRWYNHGSTVVNSETVVTTLPGLLNAMVPVSDEVLLQMQALLADAETAKDESEASALRSEAAAQESINNSILMNESEARAIQSLNENSIFGASGMVQPGKHDSNNINDGMFVDGVTSNTVFVGGGSDGSSKTDFAVNHIAGSVINAILENNQFKFELPPAPDGTVIYDSTGDARGSGKANLDLKVDVDPKYGDVAADTNEAVARAFEGEEYNGDFRLGTDGYSAFGKTHNVVDGVYTATVTSTLNVTVGSLETPLTIGEEYIAEYMIIDAGPLPAGWDSLYAVGGVSLPQSPEIAPKGELLTFRFTATASSGFRFRCYTNTVGGALSLSNLSIRKATEEVVTHPVDLAMLEYYEEELTGRQEIFECIQSLSTTFGNTDVPTVLSTRPLSYFQQYDGQFPDPTLQNDQYRCVVWDDLTDEQKRKVAAYMGEKLFKGENGHIVNGRLRARTIRGAGNGDWANFKSTDSGIYDCLRSVSGNDNVVRAKGIKDAIVEIGHINGGKLSTNGAINDRGTLPTMKGVFTATNSTRDADLSVAYKGRCFAYVVTTVPRANQGACVKGLNEYGTAKCSDDKYWHESANTPTTLKDCFIGQVGGDIASGKSGHPDGIFYDSILSGGLNGIIDWRLSAYPVDTKEDGSKGFSKVVGGSYRGLENLVKTAVGVITSNDSLGNVGSRAVTWESQNLSGAVLGDIAYSEQSDGSYRKLKVTGVYSTYLEFDSVDGLAWDRVNGGYIAVSLSTNLSVSGDFMTQMVIGDPANILQTDALKNGWLGTWCPAIPDGTSKDWPLTKKSLDSSPTHAFTADNGATWTGGLAWPFDTTRNARVGFAQPNSQTVIVSYKAFAKQTKPSTNKPVLNGSEGLGDVYVTNSSARYYGALFHESLTANVGKHNQNKSFKLTKYLIDRNNGDTIAEFSDAPPEHSAIDATAPNSDSPTVKALWYMTSDNGQVGLNFAYQELFYDATGTVGNEWGDTVAGTDYTAPHGVVPIIDGQGTLVDYNGNTVLYGLNELTMKLGWSQNKARFGTVTDGVDQ